MGWGGLILGPTPVQLGLNEWVGKCVASNAKDFTPGIIVTFPDGYTDTLVLEKHYFNQEDRMTGIIWDFVFIFTHDFRFS